MAAAELAEVVRTEERVRILRYVAEQRAVTATAIVRAEGVSKALVSRYLRRLEDEGYLVRQSRTYVWLNHARGRSVKRLLTADRLARVLRLPVWAKGIGIYGSFAEGTNTAGSDLDVWILVAEYAPDLEVSAARAEAAPKLTANLIRRDRTIEALVDMVETQSREYRLTARDLEGASSARRKRSPHRQLLRRDRLRSPGNERPRSYLVGAD